MLYEPCDPTAVGSKVFPLIPLPAKVPPEGAPVRATDEPFEQYVEFKPLKDTVGSGLTTTTIELEELNEPLVTITV